MCFPKPKIYVPPPPPPPPPPAPAPPPPEQPPFAPVLSGDALRAYNILSMAKARRRGRSALRIERNGGGMPWGGTGLNIPGA